MMSSTGAPPRPGSRLDVGHDAVQPPRQPPAPVAEQVHHRRDQQQPHDHGVDQHTAGQADGQHLPWPDYPNTEFYYFQSVDQFASAKAASSYFSQALAKYAKCTDFTESAPADSDPSSGGFETVTQSVAKTKVGKYQAFAVAQSADLSEFPGDSILLNTLITVEGTDVLAMVSVGGTNDAVPASVMQKLIGRVQKLR